MSTVRDFAAFSTVVGTPAQVRKTLSVLPAGDQLIVLTLTNRSREQAERMSEAAMRILKVLDKTLLESSDVALENFVQASVTRQAVTPAQMMEATMKRDAKNHVLKSGDWVTPGQIAQIAGLSTTNPSAQPNKWKREGRIFAINHNNNDYFPIFGLDPEHGYRPVKAMRTVLEAFGKSKSAWGLAYWFAGVNGFLGGKRPQDILSVDPERVVAAAEDEVMGVVHG
ncbi:hypothetical protein [Ottowia thiooxydans]|uniref:hypothetical protein n=1 Tax=Ottowia thiooxydans TaxID=219182 RepID=UPI0004282D1A|nr:hypothetical protein [Ottowia thiooxydans]